MRFPRYSLRMALIVLTVFLICFSLWAKHYLLQQRIAAHRAILVKLVNAGFAIEETSGGATEDVDPKLLGLVHRALTIEGLEVLRELPQPGELRGFACGMLVPDFTKSWPEGGVWLALDRCRGLERLHLIGQSLNRDQLKLLQQMHQLRILDLNTTPVPAGYQAFLEDLPNLEVLRINVDGFSLENFCELPLPKLRSVHLVNCNKPVLRLTKDGFGRFPKLERLVFEDSQFEEIVCEPDAMPALEYLGFVDQVQPCKVPWQQLPETTPRLKGLMLHINHFDETSKRELLRLPQLERMYFTRGNICAPESDWMRVKEAHVFFRAERRAELEDFIRQRPQLEFDSTSLAFLRNTQPPELDLSVHGIIGSPGRWDSPNWLKSSLQGQPDY